MDFFVISIWNILSIWENSDMIVYVILHNSYLLTLRLADSLSDTAMKLKWNLHWYYYNILYMYLRQREMIDYSKKLKELEKSKLELVSLIENREKLLKSL